MSDEMAALERWPAAHAAAAVVLRTDRGPEVVATHGDGGRPFALASVTKLLTATAVLVAVEEEAVGLDEPCGPPGSTLAHLLAHASGLGPEGAVLAPPARRRIYSNAGFELAAEHVASATAMSFDTYLRAGVLEPLAMHATELRGSPAHGATSTVDDLTLLASELMAPRLLGAALRDTAVSVAFPGLDGVLPGYGRQSPNDWGLGFELRGAKSPHWTAPANSPATFGHFGQSGTFVWVDPVRAVALVCLTDLAFGPWAIEAWPAFADSVLANFG